MKMTLLFKRYSTEEFEQVTVAADFACDARLRHRFAIRDLVLVARQTVEPFELKLFELRGALVGAALPQVRGGAGAGRMIFDVKSVPRIREKNILTTWRKRS